MHLSFSSFNEKLMKILFNLLVLLEVDLCGIQHDFFFHSFIKGNLYGVLLLCY